MKTSIGINPKPQIEVAMIDYKNHCYFIWKISISKNAFMYA